MESILPRTLLALAAILLGGAASAQITTRVSVDSNEVEGTGGAALPALSFDGRFVAFHATSANLVAGDTNGFSDIFVRDRVAGTTQRVSVATGGAEANDSSGFPKISGDGRFVVFHSAATNLVGGDTNGAVDIFLHDRQTGVTERVNVDAGGAQATGTSQFPAISADGNYVAYLSDATNLVAGDTNGFRDVFVRDRAAAVTQRASVDSAEVQANNSSHDFFPPSISATGRYVAFGCSASNLVAGDVNGGGDIFVRDLQLGTTERVSLGAGGVEGNNSSIYGVISGDGRFVAFSSNASNLAPDANFWTDIFVRDRLTATTQIVSVATGGGAANAYNLDPAISADGRIVAFYGDSTNLVAGDLNATYDVFTHDRATGVTERVSVSTTGIEGNGSSGYPNLSGDGRFVSFGSASSNLVGGDTNGFFDAFVRDRIASGFTSLCDPGSAGVIACPCGNPPSGPGRGCNNSSGTGGAILSASGMAYLSSDSLVFTTSGEKPTSLSLVAQWIGGNPTGVVFGQGVRCTSGTFKRLYSANAVGGSITLPNFGAGHLTVSAQSAAKGDTILAGQSRWYVVYYRDNTVLGGCPALSNFNATQTGKVAWSM